MILPVLGLALIGAAAYLMVRAKPAQAPGNKIYMKPGETWAVTARYLKGPLPTTFEAKFRAFGPKIGYHVGAFMVNRSDRSKFGYSMTPFRDVVLDMSPDDTIQILKAKPVKVLL